MGPPVLRRVERPWVPHTAFLHLISPVGDPAEEGDEGERGGVGAGVRGAEDRDEMAVP